MTISRFHEFLLRGGSVKCYLPEQRNELAEFIQDEFGIQIGQRTRNYMDLRPDGTDYMVVELHNTGREMVVSFCVNALGEAIPFKEVSHFMSLTEELDDRTDKEFLEAFEKLMTGGKHDD